MISWSVKRETSSHISLARFVDHYLRLIAFPADVLAALSNGEINLFEAAQLARVTASRLGHTSSQARRTRADLLSTHLQTKESGLACGSVSTSFSALQQTKREGLRWRILVGIWRILTLMTQHTYLGPDQTTRVCVAGYSTRGRE